MRCPFCGGQETQVKDSRPTEDAAAIRRRRYCPACGGRFTTFERVQLRELTVVKRNGKKVPFERDKLLRSVQLALRKRPFDQDQIERMVSGMVRRLESIGESEVSSEFIGEMVMDALREADTVAFVRFASVYKEFREASDFENFIVGELHDMGREKKAASVRKKGQASGEEGGGDEEDDPQTDLLAPKKPKKSHGKK